MLVQISSLAVCLILIQTTFNVVAGESSKQRTPRSSTEAIQIAIYPPVAERVQQIEQSSVLKIDCYIFGSPGYTWWSMNGKKLTNESESISHLIRENVTISDNGNYTCNGITKSGISFEKTIWIKVIVPGEISPVIITNSVALSGSVNLSCLVYGESLSDFSWKKINESENSRLIHLTQHQHNNRTNELMILQLVNVTREHNGTYECHANNGDRDISNVTHLIVRERPEIRNFDVKSIGVEKVRLNWTLFDGNAAVTKYNVTFKLEQRTNDNFFEEIKVSNCSHCSYDLQSNKLEGGKVYVFGITTWNSEGDTKTYLSQPINMSEIASVDMIPMNFTTMPTDHSIKINWQRENLKPDSSYCYKVNVAYSRNSAHENRTQYSTTNATSYTIKNLHANTTYSIRVQGCLGNDECTKWSPVQNVTTLEHGKNSSSSLHSVVGMNLITLTTIVSMLFSFKYDDVRSFLSL